MVRAAAFALDALFLAGGFPLAWLLARLTAGSAWPWAAALLWLAGVLAYWLTLRLSPLKATLGQDLLGLPNRAQAPDRVRPGSLSPPAREVPPSPIAAPLPPVPPRPQAGRPSPVAPAPGPAAPDLGAARPSPPASPVQAAPPPPAPARPAVRNLAPPRLSPRPTPFDTTLPPTPPAPATPSAASPASPSTQVESPSSAGIPCPRCGLGNRRDCRFCKACGTPLALRLCPACSKTAAPDARFCKSCGRPLS